MALLLALLLAVEVVVAARMISDRHGFDPPRLGAAAYAQQDKEEIDEKLDIEEDEDIDEPTSPKGGQKT